MNQTYYFKKGNLNKQKDTQVIRKDPILLKYKQAFFVELSGCFSELWRDTEGGVGEINQRRKEMTTLVSRLTRKVQ